MNKEFSPEEKATIVMEELNKNITINSTYAFRVNRMKERKTGH